MQEKHEVEFRRVVPVVGQALKDVVAQHESLIRNGASRDATGARCERWLPYRAWFRVARSGLRSGRTQIRLGRALVRLGRERLRVRRRRLSVRHARVRSTVVLART